MNLRNDHVAALALLAAMLGIWGKPALALVLLVVLLWMAVKAMERW